VSGAVRGLGLLALALITVAVVAGSSAVAPARSGAEPGSMQNCPPAGMWSIAVWDGESGTAATDALATCGPGAVDAAYSLDPQTGAWSRWFAANQGVSDLTSLDDTQGVLALGGTAAAAAGGDSLAAAEASGQFHACPPAGMWSIAVWEGESGTTAADALTACGVDGVAAAYSLDAQTGAWSRWFAGKPDVSDLPPLGDMQGVLVLGAAATPAPTPSPSPAPTPEGPAGPVVGATYVGQTSQGLLVEFDVTADGLGIDRVKFGFEGLLYDEPCQGLLNMSFGRAYAIVDNAFTINDTDYTMTGRFDSATTASGELQVHIPDRWADPGCFSDPLTWTASVQ
jgi:hypothetical protein